jgi:hypothetical protein
MDRETKESVDRIVAALAGIREQLNPFITATFASGLVTKLNAIEEQLEAFEGRPKNQTEPGPPERLR